MKLNKIISLINSFNLPLELIKIILDYSGIIKDYFSNYVLSYLYYYEKNTFGGFAFSSLKEFHYVRSLNLYFYKKSVINVYNPITIEKNYYSHDNSTNYYICFEGSWGYVRIY
jgi:hypothetical protein